MGDTQPLRRMLDPLRPLTYGIVQAGDNVVAGVRYIRPVDMSATKGVLHVGSLLRTSPEIAARYKRSALRAADVVLTIGPSYGKVMIVPPELSGANLTQGTARLAPAENVDAAWMYWALQGQTARDHWDLSVSGATFAALNLGPLGETPMPVLPRARQRRIADFLNDQVAHIDNIIAARSAQARSLEVAKIAQLDATFTVGAGPFVRLALFARVQSGITVDGGREADKGVEVPYLRVANVQSGSLDLSEVKSIPVTPGHVARFLLRSGDVLMTEGGDIDKLGRGTVWRAEIPGAIHQNHVFAVRVDQDRLLPEYLAYATACTYARDYFELTGNKTTNLASTSATKVLDMWLPFRDIDDQQKVVAQVQAHEDWARTAASQLKSSIERFGELKRSLITAAVTGEFDVSSADGSRVPV